MHFHNLSQLVKVDRIYLLSRRQVLRGRDTLFVFSPLSILNTQWIATQRRDVMLQSDEYLEELSIPVPGRSALSSKSTGGGCSLHDSGHHFLNRPTWPAERDRLLLESVGSSRHKSLRALST